MSALVLKVKTMILTNRICLVALLWLTPTSVSAQSLPGTWTPVFDALMATVAPQRPTMAPRRTPRWVTTLAVAGPLADGLSTYWAIHQSGHGAAVTEGNGVFGRIFGSDVTPGEILAFKVGQAALSGLATHFASEETRPNVILSAIISVGIHGTVSARNIKNGRQARRWNASATVVW